MDVLLYWRDDLLQMKRCAGCRPKTLTMYDRSLGSFIEFVGCAHWPPTRTDVMGFLDSVRRRCVSEETVATYWRHLRLFFNYVEVLGGFGDQPNPATQISRLQLAPQPPDTLPKAIPKDHIDRLFGYLEGLPPDPMVLRDLALFRFLYATGCRSGEAAGLLVENLDLDNRQARFPAESTKTDTERKVCFNLVCKDNLQRWLDYLRSAVGAPQYVFPAMKNNQTKVFPLPLPLRAEGVYRALRRRLLEAGLPPYRVHALRHTFANRAMNGEEKVGLAAIQKQMGHKSAAMTLLYAKAFASDLDVFKDFG